MRIAPTYRTAIGLFLLLIAFFAYPMQAQERTLPDSVFYNPDAESAFRTAISFFDTGELDSALAILSDVIALPPHHRTSAALFICGKAAIRQGNAPLALRYLNRTIEEFPSSSFALHVPLALAEANFVEGKNARAGGMLALISLRSAFPSEISEADTLLRYLAARHLTESELDSLSEAFASTKYGGVFLYYKAAGQYNEGKLDEAKVLLTRISENDVWQSVKSDAERLLAEMDAAREPTSHGKYIGVLLPLLQSSTPNELADLSAEFLTGYQAAVAEYNARNRLTVELRSYETNLNPQTGAALVEQLSEDSDVLGIVGPVFSNEAYECGRAAAMSEIALVTPTATSDGISSVGDVVFQANPDLEARGKAMAQIAVMSAGAKTAAVLAPSGGAGYFIAQAFLSEIRKLGVDTIDVEYYQPGIADLRPYFISLRRKALVRIETTFVDFKGKLTYRQTRDLIIAGATEKVVDSLYRVGGSISVTDLLGPDGIERAQSFGISLRLSTLDYSDFNIAVPNVDVLFLPVESSADLTILLPQLKLAHFQSKILGSGEWQELTILNQYPEVTEGVLFSSDSYWDPFSPRFKNFSEFLLRRFQRRPTRTTLIAYDAMSLVLAQIEKGATSRSELVSALKTGLPYEGLRCWFKFGERRVNSFLWILQYQNRGFKPYGILDVDSASFLGGGKRY